MRITHYFAGGVGGDYGTANSVRGWCEAMARAGADVRVVVGTSAEGQRRPAGVTTAPVRHAGRRRSRVPVGFADALGETDVLVLHGGWVLANNVAARVAAKRGIPYVVTPHGAYHPRVLDRRRLLKRSWAAVSEHRYLIGARAVHLFFADERAGLDELGVERPAIVVPSGFSAAAGAEWAGRQDGYVLWYGRFDVEGKGLDLLLEGLARLPEEERPPVRLHGPDWRGRKRNVHAMAERLALRSWVTVGDPVYGPPKWELLSRSAGFAYPSRWEACPMAILEATSAGVPALVTGYPLGRLLAANGAALLAESTAEGLAAGLRELRSPAARDTGDRAPSVVQRLFDWDAAARSWLDQAARLLA